ncbi:MAG: V-type ATP synthase subunit I [Clostridiaceae bacterium]|nr:V-type ATP synthase subunit I [Clostridiaceae bacterium]
MAILQMKRIDIIALRKERKDVLEMLQELGCVEIIDVDREGIEKVNTQPFIDEFERDMDLAVRAKEIVERYADRKKPFLSSFLEGRVVDRNEFVEKSKSYKSTIQLCREIVDLSKGIEKDEERKNSLQTEYDSLLIWSDLKINANQKETKHAKIYIGHFQKALAEEDILSLIDNDLVHVEILKAFKDQTCVLVLCHKDATALVEKTLRQLEFYPFEYSCSVLPVERLKEIENQKKDLEKSIEEKTSLLKKHAQKLDDIELVIDYLSIRKDKYEEIKKLANTPHVVVISAYIPGKEIERCTNLIYARFNTCFDIYDPEEDEDVPVLLENNSFVRPMESITEMYALPGKEDPDPSPVMAFFYYLLFGLMFSDAGYGLVMAVASFIMIKKKNVKESVKKTFSMFFYCGISTVFWGAVFGSWFGDIVPVIYKEFLHKTPPNMALWFNPIDFPIKFLIFAFLLGMAHLFAGVLTKGVISARKGSILDGFFDSVPIISLVTGGAFLGATYLVAVPPVLLRIGKYLLGLGVILVILAEIYRTRKILLGLGSGLYSLYNTFSGYVSDFLSYSRLLALGLCTGSVASVVNMVGVLPSNPVVKAIALTIAFLLGHSLNFAINALGAYVHTNRLMFIELFSKFYEGGGRAFKPFRINTAYVKIKEEI